VKAIFIIFALILAAPVLAHELRPAFLELKQTAEGMYDLAWKVPVVGDLRSTLRVKIPEKCHPLEQPRNYTAGGSYIERVSIQCEEGLVGSEIRIEGLAATPTDVLVRVARQDGTSQSVRLTPSVPSFVVEAAPNWTQAAATYLRLGIKHILLGIDHLLFVLGLLVIVGKRRMLMLKTITAFTLAHSLTLAAATLGIVEVAAEPLNAVIALSILFLGVEVIRQMRGKTSFTIERPWIAAFGFGLVHGFGFASGLSTLGLPPNEIVAALLFFNVGVELGQIAFVILYLLFLRSLQILEVETPAWSHAMPAYAIGSLGAYWTIANTLKFFLVRG
jgi:hypothetical protein